MILKSYIFCDGGKGYRQYPNDHSEKFLKQFCTESQTSHQIAVHRDGNLMYYAYSYRNSNQELYGLCVVCGEICVKLKSLYDYFQEALNVVAIKGVLFKYNASGEIILNVSDFISEKGETEEVFREIKSNLDKRRFWETLPPEDYSIPLDSKIVFSFDENEQAQIVDATRHYHTVLVTMENPIPTSFSMTVKKLNSEKAQLQKELETRHEEIQNLSRQKKQYKTVVLLALLLLVGSIVTAIIISNKNTDIENKVTEIESLYETKQNLETNIMQLNSSIEDLNDRNSRLESSYQLEHSRYIEAQSNYEEAQYNYEEAQSNYDYLTDKISSRQPFFITNTSFSFSSGWFEMTYFGVREGNYTIRINVYAENGNRVRSDTFSNYHFEEGAHSKSFYVTSSLNSGAWYYFEVCIDNIIIGGRKH